MTTGAPAAERPHQPGAGAPRHGRRGGRVGGRRRGDVRQDRGRAASPDAEASDDELEAARGRVASDGDWTPSRRPMRLRTNATWKSRPRPRTRSTATSTRTSSSAGWPARASDEAGAQRGRARGPRRGPVRPAGPQARARSPAELDVSSLRAPQPIEGDNPGPSSSRATAPERACRAAALSPTRVPPRPGPERPRAAGPGFVVRQVGPDRLTGAGVVERRMHLGQVQAAEPGEAHPVGRELERARGRADSPDGFDPVFQSTIVNPPPGVGRRRRCARGRRSRRSRLHRDLDLCRRAMRPLAGEEALLHDRQCRRRRPGRRRRCRAGRGCRASPPWRSAAPPRHGRQCPAGGKGRRLGHGAAQGRGEPRRVLGQAHHGGGRQVARHEDGDLAAVSEPAALLEEQVELFEHREGGARQGEQALLGDAGGAPARRDRRRRPPGPPGTGGERLTTGGQRVRRPLAETASAAVGSPPRRAPPGRAGRPRRGARRAAQDRRRGPRAGTAR